MRMNLLLATAAATLLLATGAQAQTKTFHADATTAQEVPPVTGAASGKGTFTLNPATKELMWNVTYSGLSSDAAAAHIHGPAAAGANAGVVVNLAPSGMKSPLEGKATLTDAQIADLQSGKYYLNVHTANNKGGEIRGQIK
jgi:hypothetical protein